MEVGALGKNGHPAVYRVGSECIVGHVRVRTQHHLAAEKTALETTLNQVLVMQASVQVSVRLRF